MTTAETTRTAQMVDKYETEIRDLKSEIERLKKALTRKGGD
jgi:uncharacterized small protein (DUF1192 family)